MAAYYFGCYGRAGHYLFGPRGQRLSHYEQERLGLPDHDFDACPFLLPREVVGDGALTYLPAMDRTALSWWGSPWDKRGKVNSHVLADGRLTADEAWRQFEADFPDLAKHLAMPRIVRSYTSANTEAQRPSVSEVALERPVGREPRNEK